MQKITYKLAEFFIIFIIIPVSFAVQYSVWLKLIIGATGFLYILFILLRIEKNRFKIAPNLSWPSFFKRN